MSDIVDFNTGKMIPELEAMVEHLFDKDEVQAIHSKRKIFENKIRKISKCKDDFIKYIIFETQFLKILKFRNKKRGKHNNAKMSKLQFHLQKRLQRLHLFAIRFFPQDLRLWITYIKYCQQVKLGSAARKVLGQMLDHHGHNKPELFKIAARIEKTEFKDIEKARKYLLRGIHIHKDNKLLLTEAFSLELYDADRKKREVEETDLTPNTKDILISIKRAEHIYDNAIKMLKDVELMNDLMEICTKYEFASSLENKIALDLYEHESNERMWDIVARRELYRRDEKLSNKQKIKKCLILYDNGTKRLNTDKMWGYYLDTLIELQKEATVLPVYKRKILLSAFNDAANKGKLTEKYYLKWASLLEGLGGRHKQLVEMLQGAVKKLPDSVMLWYTLLKVHLQTNGEEKQANQVFDKGVAALTKHSIPLWQLMIQFEQINGNKKVEELFKKGCNECPEISETLSPMYLEWLVLMRGIVVARKAYDKMCETISPCLEMHKKMIYLESIQPDMFKNRIRKCYTIACAQFGETDVDLWMEFYRFEVKNGSPKKVCETYQAAEKNLSSDQFESFVSELSIFSADFPLEANANLPQL